METLEAPFPWRKSDFMMTDTKYEKDGCMEGGSDVVPGSPKGKSKIQWLEVRAIWSLTQFKEELFVQPEWTACPETDFVVVVSV